MASAPSPSIMVLGFLCKRKPFTYNHQGLKCCGVVPRGLYETKCRMEVSGTPTTPHRPSYAPKPGGPAPISFRACLASGEPGTPIPPFCLCNSFLPSIGHSLSVPSWRRLPLSGRGAPLARRLGPTHFLCRPNPASTRSRWKVSLKMGGSFFLPGGPRKPKASTEVRGGLSGFQEGK